MRLEADALFVHISKLRSRLLVDHFVGASSYPLQRHFNVVSILQPQRGLAAGTDALGSGEL